MTAEPRTVERQSPPTDPAVFFDRLLVLAREAQTLASGPVSACLQAGRWRFELRFASTALMDRVLPALAHVAGPDDCHAPRLIVDLFDGCEGRLELPPAPWSPTDYDGRGEITGFNDGRWLTVIDVAGCGFRMLDRSQGRGVCYFPSAATAPPQGWTMPVMGLVAADGRGRPEQVVHGAAVGTDAGGVLVTGRSGSGKSTTTAACVAGGLRTAGDDLVLVEWQDAPVVHSLMSTLKLDAPTLARFPALGALADGAETAGREKQVVHMARGPHGPLARSLSLRAILVARVRGTADSRLLPAAPADAVKEMAPSTLFMLPGTGAEGVRKMADLARRVPCYWLECGTDLVQLPQLIRGLLA